ncbi:MAG: SDR family oxidoreductase [Deltaproteobacteria bacterium]|jgi:3-oxoacyl-[acyl-carrier protein] reductase|nr:SDR family oxidoreductase [Deltaproteobacteria bacterium]
MLKDRVAIITGAVRGIGLGIAKKFAENGCHIVLNVHPDQSEEGVKKAKDIEGLGVTCMSVGADISDSKQVADLVRKTIGTFGKTDILVNNAAVAPHPKSVIDIPEEEWDLVLAVNLKGAFLLCKEVSPFMKQAGYGRIINISATSGIAPTIRDAHYNSSKAGLNMLTKDVAVELAPFNVTVNSICPGIIRTELTESVVPPGVDKTEFFASITKVNIPMERPGYPEDVANAALFFASDLASYVTGETLLVAGGAPLFRARIPE